MIIDSSALVAILRQEPEADRYVELVLDAPITRMSTAGYLETAIVIDMARNPASSRRLDEFIREAGIVLEAFTPEHARVARDAYRDFGKGSGHPAGLNFGDCMAYALATERRETLLFKGADFAATDVKVAAE